MTSEPAPEFVAIHLSAPADADIIIGNLPANIRSNPFDGPFLDFDGVLHVPACVAALARAIAADIEGYRPTAWAETEVHAAWLKAALAEIGKLDAVNAATVKAGAVPAALWATATTIRADDRDVIAVARALDIDLPTLFRRAASLRKERSS